MHNILLIAKREYLERVRTKAFIVSTVLIPVLMGGGIFFSAMKSRKAKGASHIAIVSTDTPIALDLQQELKQDNENPIVADVISPPGATTRKDVIREVDDKEIDGFLWVDMTGSEPKANYSSASKLDMVTTDELNNALRRVLVRQGLIHHGIGQQDIDSMMLPVKVQTQTIKNGELHEADSMMNFIGVYVLFFLMYMAVMLHGMNVARSIIEEKTSRVFEVMLATVKPQEMMTGKLLGVGGVGITQIGIWVIAALLLTSQAIAGAIGTGDIPISFTVVQILAFIVYFILGFLLYSGMAAAIGAMVNSEQELQQYNMLIAMPMAVCAFVFGPVIANPNGVFATVMSLIPTFTPLLMYLRISIANPAPPIYEVGGSLLIMVATIWAVMWVTSRIYRVGILMYGKKPSLPEILRWIRYS